MAAIESVSPDIESARVRCKVRAFLRKRTAVRRLTHSRLGLAGKEMDLGDSEAVKLHLEGLPVSGREKSLAIVLFPLNETPF